MPMKYKTQCICQHPNWNKDHNYYEYHDKYDAKEHDENKDIERDLTLDIPDFETAHVYNYLSDEHWDEIKNDVNVDGRITDQEEVFYWITCTCGDKLVLSDNVVCSCGRIWKVEVKVLKDDTHKDDMEYWDKIKASKYKRFGKEDE